MSIGHNFLARHNPLPSKPPLRQQGYSFFYGGAAVLSNSGKCMILWMFLVGVIPRHQKEISGQTGSIDYLHSHSFLVSCKSILSYIR
jgi:hypothetical protein